jgi:hypothetical protein
LEEKKRKSVIGTDEANGNGTKPVLINKIQADSSNQIEAIRENNYRKQQRQQSHARNNEPVKCTHCKKSWSCDGEMFCEIPIFKTTKPRKTTKIIKSQIMQINLLLFL